MSILKTLFGGKSARRLARYEKKVALINALAPGLEPLSDQDIRDRSDRLRERAQSGTSLDDLLVEAFALCREAGRRTIGLRHFDVQLIGGMALHDGLFAEMKTGEGKTLVATLPAYLNALPGEGIHVVTVNDYLAKRDAEWMGAIYNMLGLSVGIILENMGMDEATETRNRQAAYACDITYGTNHEIAFDYLRDNLATNPEEIVHRNFAYALVDEVDFLLIDEARTPLIISEPAREDVSTYRRVDNVVRRLKEGLHYQVEIKTKTAVLTETGFEAAESALNVSDLTDMDNLDTYHALCQSVLAHGAHKRDVDYIVMDGDVQLVDEFTGRVSEDKRYSDGLHQAIEAKEKVRVKSEDRTAAKVTYQTFFGRYRKLAGMTGTAWSAKREFLETYHRDVLVVPTNAPMIRKDYPTVIFDSLDEKHQAIVDEIKVLREEGRAVLVGSTSVQESERLARRLKRANIPHNVLNAKNHQAEATIIAQAGRKANVTISTNMAGRGTDIVLGGNPEMMPRVKDRPKELERLIGECAQEHAEVVAAGGLHVIGTTHHEAARIDNQLRGRSGRQGDPGSSQFVVSLDDEIWQKFGKREIEALREELDEAEYPQGKPIESPAVQRMLKMLQKKVDEENLATRRDVVKYDLVVHAQRETIYGWRRTLVTGEGYDPQELIGDLIHDLMAHKPDREALQGALKGHFNADFELPTAETADLEAPAVDQALNLLEKRRNLGGREALDEVGRRILLQTIDDLWTEHLTNLERLEEGIDLRSYAEVDPIVPWRQETAAMWDELLRNIRSRAVTMWFLVDVRPERARRLPRSRGHRRARKRG